MAESRLFKPMKIGNIEIKHRIGMAPLTRVRATEHNVPTPLMKEYYSQRASAPGTLIISEGTFISPSSRGGWPNVPGVWSQEQVLAWKEITEEVHRKGCFIYCQVFATGRAAKAEEAEKHEITIVGPSAIPIDKNAPVPEPMTIENIKQVIQEFATASKNAVQAGFDGVEIHCANGFLVDQFTQDNSNKRSDDYGGTVENRSRFVNEIMKAVVDAIGPERVGLRLSPFSDFQGMRMANPEPQFADVIDKASKLNLAYLHLIESRISGAEDVASSDRLDFAYERWNGPILVAGGYKVAEAKRLVDEEYPEKDIMVIMGRHFVSNPDLIFRIKKGLELAAYDRETFYASFSTGYIDYPFSKEFLATGI